MFFNSILTLLIFYSPLQLSSDKNPPKISEKNPKELTPVVDKYWNYKKGYNEAIFNHHDDSPEKLQEIIMNYEKYKLLKKLESNSISLYEKIKFIEENYLFDEQVSSNLIAGGLLEDWNFEM
jgi:hypothetical protein